MANTSESYDLLIDLNEYAGNYKRAICAYLFGINDEYAQEYCEKIRKQWRSEVPAEIRNQLDDLVEVRSVDEYGLMPYTIEWYQGNCNTVVIFLSRYPDNVINYIIERLGKEVKLLDLMQESYNTVKIEGIRIRLNLTVSKDEVLVKYVV